MEFVASVGVVGTVCSGESCRRLEPGGVSQVCNGSLLSGRSGETLGSVGLIGSVGSDWVGEVGGAEDLHLRTVQGMRCDLHLRKSLYHNYSDRPVGLTASYEVPLRRALATRFL